MLRTTRALRIGLLACALAAVFTVGVTASRASVARACGTGTGTGTETYSTRGVVKSFGVDRKYVNIAHEKIAGYMEAMTMSFEPKAAEQFASLEVGDRVAFTFTATEDGRRILQSIKKDAPPATR